MITIQGKQKIHHQKIKEKNGWALTGLELHRDGERRFRLGLKGADPLCCRPKLGVALRAFETGHRVGPRGKNVLSLIRQQASGARGAGEDLRGMATLGSPLQCLVRIWFGYLVELLELVDKAITAQSNLQGTG